MPTRSRKQEKQYGKYKKHFAHKKGCDFCVIDASYDQLISETKSFKILKNIFPYSSWDDQSVEEHLLIVPKRHIDTIGDLTAPEAVEYIDLLASYESRGYNVYMRAPQSTVKSVAHQHTHFIRPTGRIHRLMFMLSKPYIHFAK